MSKAFGGPSLASKTILVTGAASGIGEAAARHFIECGATVLLADVAVEKGEKVAAAIGEDAHFIPLDVTSEESWQEAMQKAAGLGVPIDGLFNCAGLVDVLDDIDDVALAQWQRVFKVNVDGSYLGCKYAVRAMREKGGAIVNVASIYASVGGTGSLAYAASKGGILMLTQSVAQYCLSRGYAIRCNDVLPGYIETEGLGASWDLLGGKQRIADMHPVRRLGQPEEVATVVAFLLSDEASYITGAHYPIDGGYLAQ
jgi:NAD(P)-dependent dehydrogenase (short-subunit alcohol dehydrogenase family)